MSPEFLSLPDRQLAYQRLSGHENKPGIVFCGGFASDMTGTKASYLADKCSKAGLNFLRFDYRGHGQSSGDFKEATLGDWFEDTCAVIERLTKGPQIVVGSSMGGWLGLLLAIQKPECLKAFIGIAAAPDFTEDLMWLKMTKEQQSRLERDGFIYDETAPEGEQAVITLKLVKEARQHLLLRKVISVQCPVRLLQGLNDREVPWQHAIRITENCATDDVRTIFIKEGDHRLSRPQDLDLLWRTIEEFI
ncbi:MAG: alpha/beta hydrolase [Alphaproteobacteria bacterium]